MSEPTENSNPTLRSEEGQFPKPEDSVATNTENKQTGLHLREGGVYRRRDNLVATIQSSCYNKSLRGHLYICGAGLSYDEHGRYYWDVQEESIYDLIEEIDCTTQEEGRTTFSFKPTTPFLTTVDIINIGQYVNKIEELANKVGLDVEIRLTPSTKEGM